MLSFSSFQDAYKTLNYQEILYSEFLHALRDKPELLAVCLAAGDRLSNSSPDLSLPVSEVTSTVFSGLYGSCLMKEDERLVLKLLHSLMELQLTSASNPRKLLRQGNCAFSKLYKVSVFFLCLDA